MATPSAWIVLIITLQKQCHCSDSLGKYLDVSLQYCHQMQDDIWTMMEYKREQLKCIHPAVDSLEGKFVFEDWSLPKVLTDKPYGRSVWFARVGESMNTELCLPMQLYLGYNISFTVFDMSYSGDKCHYDRLEIFQIGKNDTQPHVQRYCGRRPPMVLGLQAVVVCIKLISGGNYKIHIELYYQLRQPKIISGGIGNIIEISSNMSLNTQLLRSLAYHEWKAESIAEYRWVLRAPWAWRLSLVTEGELEKDEYLVIIEGPDNVSPQDVRYVHTFCANVTSYGPVVNMNLFSRLSSKFSTVNLTLHAVDQLPVTKEFKLHSGSSVISINYQLSCPKNFGITYCLLSIDSRPGTYPNVSVTEFVYEGPDIHSCMYTIVALYSHIVSSDNVIYSFCRDDEPNIKTWSYVSSANRLAILIYHNPFVGHKKMPLSLTIRATSTICRGVSIQVPNVSWNPPPLYGDRIEDPCVHLQIRPMLRYSPRLVSYNVFKIARSHSSIKQTIDVYGIFKWKLSSVGWNGHCQERERIYGRNGRNPFCGDKITLSSGQMCSWSRQWIDITITDTCNMTEAAMYCQNLCNNDFCVIDPQCNTMTIPPVTASYMIRMSRGFMPVFHRNDLGRYHLPMDHLINRECTWNTAAGICGVFFKIKMLDNCPQHCTNNTVLFLNRTGSFTVENVLDITNQFVVNSNREVVFARELHRMGHEEIKLTISVGDCAEGILQRCSVSLMYRMTLLSMILPQINFSTRTNRTFIIGLCGTKRHFME